MGVPLCKQPYPSNTNTPVPTETPQEKPEPDKYLNQHQASTQCEEIEHNLFSRRYCRIHPSKLEDLLCKECQTPVCSQCITHGLHQNHHFLNLELTFHEALEKCHYAVLILESTRIPKSQRKIEEIKDNEETMNRRIEYTRSSMKECAIAIKKMVDDIETELSKKIDVLKISMTEGFQEQKKMMNTYLSDLQRARDEYKYQIEANEPRSLISYHNQGKLALLEIEPKLPIIQSCEFIPGQIKLNGIQNIFGKLQIGSEDMKSDELSILDEDMYMEENTMPTFIMVREIPMTKLGLNCCYHISGHISGYLWLSDDMGNIVKSDMNGNPLLKMATPNSVDGYHTVSRDGDLFYVEKDKSTIVKVTPGRAVETFINTEDWEPVSIYCSKINDDVIVGLRKNKEAKVTKYEKFGMRLKDFHRDKEGNLFQWPHFLTENKNGDICVSDFGREALIVVKMTGNIRCVYKGKKNQSTFLPYGVCTDSSGRIFVTNGDSFDIGNSSIHVLDQKGHFLFFFVCSPELTCPAGIWVDEDGKIYCGSHSSLSKSICVYRYIEQGKVNRNLLEEMD
ncbi:uncharacterized protein LOC133194538 [Saccostrea echinata]|uniref:uncharacterized protein LOC133194538 n=1 Tax=Saccostrea echinata TaxID=191078 RepID=UPI002A802C7B|nr:uncharacterized protein LOC133194538 [Saccostrea echinata]